MMFRRRHSPSSLQRLLIFLWPRRGLQRGWRYVWHRVTRLAASPHAIALGFAAGTFASFTPYIGLHVLLAAVIALAVGGSIVAAAFGTIVGNPITFPFIWLATYNLGAYLLGYEPRTRIHLDLPDGMLVLLFTEPETLWRAFWKGIGPYIWPMTVGSIPLGLGSAVAVYFVVRSAVAGYQGRRQARSARRQARSS